MSDLYKAAQQALEALEEARASMQYGGVYDKAITVLRAALAQQAEPVADAETYLRDRYGAARGHHAWRELTEAFNAGCASAQQVEPVRCWCESCDMAANGGLRTRMSVCPSCGDKRCQRAKHHDNACNAGQR